jgi:hypothetical protein
MELKLTRICTRSENERLILVENEIIYVSHFVMNLNVKKTNQNCNQATNPPTHSYEIFLIDCRALFDSEIFAITEIPSAKFDKKAILQK